MADAETTIDVPALLAPGGAVARRLGEAFEPRPQQVAMAAAVQRAFRDGTTLLAEAGTGVGKSFAYLLPAIDAAVRGGKRVVVSTHTIALQEQIVDRDIPLLREIYAGAEKLNAVLVKGRGNYLCLRRLDNAARRAGSLFNSEAERQSLLGVEAWAAETKDGDVTSLPTVPDGRVWEQVRAEAGNCLGKRCKFFRACHWQAAKRRMQAGRLLVVNHALFFSDLALREAGVKYLPDYDHVVLDEAHTVEDAASQHFGLRVGEGGVRQQLRSLFDATRTKGFLTTLAQQGADANKINDLIGLVVEAQAACESFFDRCLAWRDRHAPGNGRVRSPAFVDDDLSPRLREIGLRLRDVAKGFDADKDDAAAEKKLETTNRAEKATTAADLIASFVGQSMPDAVYWVEATGRTPRRGSLHASPVDLGEGLRSALWGKVKGLVLTSATLATTAAPPPSPTAREPRGTGFQPVFPGHDAEDVTRTRRHLPHFRRAGSVYAVTFRLADSLPRAKLAEIEAAVKALSPSHRAVERRTRLEAALDAGAGSCLLRDPRAAAIVGQAVRHFAGDRYRLAAWCVMPNHVHAVVNPLGGNDLAPITHSIKSFTANRINRAFGRSGRVWQDESYDRLIRDAEELRRQVDYVRRNPAKAGLRGWRWVEVDEDLLSRWSDEDVGEVPDDRLEACPTFAGGGSGDGTGIDVPPAEPDPGFDHVRRRLGLGDAAARRFGSPFDYRRQARLHVDLTLPEPGDPRFAVAAAGRILHWVRRTNGGAFVLFTSYKAMIDAANRLHRDFEQGGLPLFVQGQRMPRRAMLDAFREASDGVLFGTSSFWQGVDVRGEALRNVVIHKLPFAPPDDPVTQARVERVEAAGGSGFMDHSVPEAAIRLKQGFGRLIRSQTDRGIVVLLDKRVVTKRYGRALLEALPDVEVVREQ